MWECANCEVMNEDIVENCIECGAKKGEILAIRKTEMQEKTTNCTKCNRKNEANARFCVYCGTSIKPRWVKYFSSGKCLLFGIVLCLIHFICVKYGIFLEYRIGQNSAAQVAMHDLTGSYKLSFYLDFTRSIFGGIGVVLIFYGIFSKIIKLLLYPFKKLKK